MNLADARSYFDMPFERMMADPAEVARQLEAHTGDDTHESVLDAIRTLAAFTQFMARARKQSSAAKTLAGTTALTFLYQHGGEIGYGKVNYELWRTHRRTRRASERQLEKLEADGVIVVDYADMTARLADPEAFNFKTGA